MSRGQRRVLEDVARNRYWRAEEAEVVLTALEESELSVAAFSRKHGLSAARLVRWRDRLGQHAPRSGRSSRRSAKAGVALRFHPVQVVDSALVSVSPQESELELLLAGNRRIVIRRGFDAELLGELVRVVEGWSRC